MKQGAKKARPTDGAAGQAAGSCDWASQQSREQYNTGKVKTATIYELLPVGAENAISCKQLMEITGLEDRQLRRRIAAERRDGKIILSSFSEVNGGYYIPADMSEVRRWVLMMEAHGSSVYEVLRAAKEAIAAAERGDIADG